LAASGEHFERKAPPLLYEYAFPNLSPSSFTVMIFLVNMSKVVAQRMRMFPLCQVNFEWYS
jgi:hypothetical protein